MKPSVLLGVALGVGVKLKGKFVGNWVGLGVLVVAGGVGVCIVTGNDGEVMGLVVGYMVGVLEVVGFGVLTG